jgi:hypothetical protein
MNCEKYPDLIEELIAGELEERTAGEVHAHLGFCASCAAFYKTALREKELYAQYLFDAEPPCDMWAKFQAKLEREAPLAQPVQATAPAADWKNSILGFFRPLPALGMAALLIVSGLGLSKLRRPETGAGSGVIARTEIDNARADENREPPDLPVDIKIDDPAPLPPKIVKIAARRDFNERRRNDRTAGKTVAVKPPGTSEKIALRKRKKPSEMPPNEDLLRLRALEKAATAQIEKTELLLRSFRNARLTEGSSVYDVGYEKQQARRLLETNVELRRLAESFGDLSTQEILDRIEPLLLDIANLENSPAAERVRDIQMRVRSQNIIASLQTY